jgi:hypothetical protein
MSYKKAQLQYQHNSGTPATRPNAKNLWHGGGFFLQGTSIGFVFIGVHSWFVFTGFSGEFTVAFSV